MIQFDYITTNGIQMHYASAGEGPLVILLHGFPEFWYSWRHQIPALAAAGFRVVAPDLRGWGKTDKPKGVESYRWETLLKDIDGLRQALGSDQAHLVGHDWGGALAWGYAATYPSHVGRLAVLNCPHPKAFRRLLKSSWKQLFKSWYIAFFQIPWLPETLTRLSDYRAIRAQLARTVHPKAMSELDLELYLENVRQPGALTAGINYYRAMGRHGAGNLGIGRVKVPTRLIWGERDAYLERDGAELSKGWAPPGTQVKYIADAGHWVQLDRPDLVNRWLIEFFQSNLDL
jgi:pimeloyl-ACP methyl ester carboxylesterase